MNATTPWWKPRISCWPRLSGRTMPWSSSMATSHVSFFNAAAERIWGLDRAEVLGRHVGASRTEDTASAGRRSAKGRPFRDQRSSARMAAGSAPRCRSRTSRSAVKAARIAFVRDITTEGERRERMALLELVADKTNRAVIVTDRNLKIVYTNAAFTGDVRLFDRGSDRAGRRSNCWRAAHTDRRTLAKLRRWIGRGNRRRGGNPRLRQERRRDLDFGQRQGVPQRPRAGQIHVRAC